MQAPRYSRYIEVMLSQASQLPHLIGVVPEDQAPGKANCGLMKSKAEEKRIGKHPACKEEPSDINR